MNTHEVQVHCTLQEGKWLRYWSAELPGFHPPDWCSAPGRRSPTLRAGYSCGRPGGGFATVQADATNQDACEKAVRNAASVLMRITAPFWGKEAVSPDTTT